jgi:flagellar motor protein MotB
MEGNLQEWEEYDVRVSDDFPQVEGRTARPPRGHHYEAQEGPFLIGGSRESVSRMEGSFGESELGETESVTEYGVPEFEQEVSTEFLSSDESEGTRETSEMANVTPGYEADPYAGIRPAMAPEHAHLPAEEVTVILGRLPAALALHQLVHSPEIKQATLASFLGKAARKSVRVNGSNISLPAYFRLIARLSGEVAEQSEAEIVSEPSGIVCTFPPAVVISGYSEYAAQLDAGQKALMTSVAQQVVDSFATNTPVAAIRVAGHSDTALRKPIAERPKFEMEVSMRRAQSATKDLRAEIARLDGGRHPDRVRALDFDEPVGMGATKKVVSNPQNEIQMKKNRRVEIYLTPCTVPKAWTWVDTAIRGVAIVPADTDAHKRIRCMLELLLRLREKAADGYLDYQNWKGLFFPPGFTEEQKERLLRGAITHLEKQLGVRSVYGPANEVPDREFISALESVDEVITRSMRDFKLNAEAGGAGASVIIVRGWKLIQLNRLNPNSIYSCYASYSW